MKSIVGADNAHYCSTTATYLSDAIRGRMRDNARATQLLAYMLKRWWSGCHTATYLIDPGFQLLVSQTLGSRLNHSAIKEVNWVLNYNNCKVWYEQFLFFCRFCKY